MKGVKKVLKVFGFIILGLLIIGLLGGTTDDKKDNNKQENKQVVKEEKDTREGIRQSEIEDKVKDFGCINIHTQFGTSASQKSIEKKMKKTMVKHLNDIRKREDYKDVVSVYFAFYGDTNKGNVKIGQFRFDDLELSNLPNELKEESIMDYASSQWYIK